MLSRTREQNNSVVSIGRTWLRTCNRAVNKTPARWPETAGEGRNSPDQTSRSPVVPCGTAPARAGLEKTTVAHHFLSMTLPAAASAKKESLMAVAVHRVDFLSLRPETASTSKTKSASSWLRTTLIRRRYGQSVNRHDLDSIAAKYMCSALTGSTSLAALHF